MIIVCNAHQHDEVRSGCTCPACGAGVASATHKRIQIWPAFEIHDNAAAKYRLLSARNHADRRPNITYDLRERPSPTHQNSDTARAPANMSDAEEEVMANEYREAAQYDGMDDLDRVPSVGSGDIQAQLAAAATPLEFQATLETKFASYDNYCNLFHFILNSDGPVDIDVPNVRHHFQHLEERN